MFVSEKIVFLELQKTASSHTGKLLKQVIGGQQIGLHNRPPKILLEQNYNFICSIRNPWDWYVSLWAYGCAGKGGLYSRVLSKRNLRGIGIKSHPFQAIYAFLMKSTVRQDQWKQCYDDVSDISKFREWLLMLNDKTYWNDFGEEYGYSSLTNFAGLMTYRYIKLCCKNIDTRYFKNISSYDELKCFDQDNCYIDYFIRQESLEDDLIMTLNLCGLKVNPEEILSGGRTNASPRKRDTVSYYDKEMKEIILKRERLIIDKFDYKRPCNAKQQT